MSVTTRYREAIERLDRAALHLAGCIEHLEDEAAGVKAQTYDPVGRSNVSSVLVCKNHGIDLSDCQRDGYTCTVAVPVAVHSDPTGETAMEDDNARDALNALDGKVRKIETLARWFDDFVHDHSPREARKANPVESKKAEQANRKPVGCARCEKVGNWSVPHTAKPTDVGGILDTPVLLCEPHYDFVRTRGRLPNEEEDRRYARTGRWPKIRQTERLAVGIRSGILS